jgi:hypothetical protein
MYVSLIGKMIAEVNKISCIFRNYPHFFQGKGDEANKMLIA